MSDKAQFIWPEMSAVKLNVMRCQTGFPRAFFSGAKKKHIKTIFTGLSRDFGGILFMFFSRPEGMTPQKTHK